MRVFPWPGNKLFTPNRSLKQIIFLQTTQNDIRHLEPSLEYLSKLRPMI